MYVEGVLIYSLDPHLKRYNNGFHSLPDGHIPHECVQKYVLEVLFFKQILKDLYIPHFIFLWSYLKFHVVGHE